MKVLPASVLATELVVLLLLIPVAYFANDQSAVAAYAVLAVAVLCLVTLLMIRRGGPAIVLGWLVQGLALASSALVIEMLPLAVIFLVLWWAALHFGARADALRAQRRREAGLDP